MKRSILSVMALSAFLMTAGFALGQAQPATPAAPANQQKLYRVATIKGVDAVREFQANVQLLQNQRQAAMDLDAAFQKEKDAQKKKKLKADYDAVVAKLNENNTAMAKVYGFSLNRNYTMEIESANIYMLISDEEAAKLEKAQKAAEAQKATDPKQKTKK